jgi:acetyl-CoA acetyltransferase
MTGRAAAAVVGVGYSAIERSSDRGIVAFAAEAASDALTAAGIDRDEIDGYVGIAHSPNPGAAHIDGYDEVSAYLMVASLGLGPLAWAADVSGFAVTMAATAAQAIASGACSCVLGVRAVYHAAASRAPAGGPAGRPPAAGAERYPAPLGAGPAGARFAPRLRRYLDQSGARREDLWEIVRSSREHARRNPVAVFRDREVSLESYLDAPMIVDPLCLYDCDMPVCGAGAFVMVSADRAAASGRPAAYLRSATNWTNADAVLEAAGITRDDIQCLQLYDGYSFLVYEWLERLGWCEQYSAWKFISDGETRPGGRLPVNTFGGALGEGRLHGMGHLREGVVQVMGLGGDRQVPDVRNCLVQIGPWDRSALAVLSTEPGGAL